MQCGIWPTGQYPQCYGLNPPMCCDSFWPLARLTKSANYFLAGKLPGACTARRISPPNQENKKSANTCRVGGR